jgi:hypothetical protein
MLKPLTGTATIVAWEVNTVVDERLVPESMPVNHDSVWPSVSIDVHWDGKCSPANTSPLFGRVDRKVN